MSWPQPAKAWPSQIPVTERPDLVIGAAADIASLTPAHQVLSVGGSSTLTAGQDANLLAQRHAAWAVKDGISLFTRGEAMDAQRAVQDVGIKLHAASGNVNTQAQSGPFSLTALKSVDLQSTAADIVISAPGKILLNGGGGYVKIEGGGIEIGPRGTASLVASVMELGAGGGAPRGGLSLPAASDLPGRFSAQLDIADLIAAIDDGEHMSYTAQMPDGSVIKGYTDARGLTSRLTSPQPGAVQFLVGEDDWHVDLEADEPLGN